MSLPTKNILNGDVVGNVEGLLRAVQVEVLYIAIHGDATRPTASQLLSFEKQSLEHPLVDKVSVLSIAQSENLIISTGFDAVAPNAA